MAAAFFWLALPARAEERSRRFGHFAYDEAPASSLAPAGAYRATGRVVQLRAEAAAAFQRMAEAGLQEGVGIVPISGFRTRAYQEGLFERAIQRHGSEKKAARWVAPPGHSEHHTGWALDLGDAGVPASDVEPAFEKTPAFRWLSKNGSRFGFELSFPRGSPQGVSHEPWHWRYVGDERARAVFHPPRGDE